MEEEISDAAMLTVSRGGQWLVKLSKQGKNLFFKEGWEQFYEGNSLKAYDLLLFVYHGNSQFNVDIFDNSGVRKG